MKVRIWRDYRRDKIQIFVSPRTGKLLRWNVTEDIFWPEGTEDPGEYGTLDLDEELARALYDELKVFYGESGDYSQLRKDYDHERGRVDKFISRLLQ